MKEYKSIEEIKERIVKTDKGYFFDTEAGYYLKLSDEVCEAIDAPTSNFQDEGERWETVEDLLEDPKPHLNSRNLLERFCEWVNNKVLQLQLGGDVIGLTGSRLEGWIDEFLESESKHE